MAVVRRVREIIGSDVALTVDGHVTAVGPGLGIAWDENAVARYAA